MCVFFSNVPDDTVTGEEDDSTELNALIALDVEDTSEVEIGDVLDAELDTAQYLLAGLCIFPP